MIMIVPDREKMPSWEIAGGEIAYLGKCLLGKMPGGNMPWWNVPGGKCRGRNVLTPIIYLNTARF